MAKTVEQATLKVTGEADLSNIEKGLAKLDAKLNQMSKSQKGLNTETGKSEKGLLDFAKGAQAAVAALAASAVVKFTVEMVNLGAATEQSRMALEAMSAGHADEYIRAIQDASLGTIDSLSAMGIATKSLQTGLVGSADEMARLTELAMVLSQVTGTTATKALDDLTLGINRQSKMILDNQNIFVDLEAIHTETNRLMAEDATLTQKAAEQRAWLNAVLIEGQKVMEQTGGVMQTTATDIAGITAAWQDLKVEMGQGAAKVFGPAIKGARDLAVGIRDLKAAKETVRSEVAAESDTFEEYVSVLAEVGLVNKGVARAIEEGGAAATAAGKDIAKLRGEYEQYRDAALEVQRAQDLEGWNSFMVEMGMVEGATEEATVAIEDQEEALRKAEQAQKAYIDSLRDQLRRQESIADITAGLVGKFDTLGQTFYSVIPVNNDAALAAERYGENLGDLRAQAGQLAQDIQYLGDGEGALQAKLDQTNAAISQQEAAMAAAGAQAGDLRTTYTITQLTQEQLNLVSESFMGLLAATGNELLMAGDSYDQYRLKMGQATEEQLRMEMGQLALMDALKAGRVTVEEAGDIYTAFVTGQVTDVEAAVAAQQAHNEVMSQATGILDEMRGTDVGETFTEAAEPAANFAEQLGISAEAAQAMQESIPLAFETLAQVAPGASEAMAPLALALQHSDAYIKGMIAAAPEWATAMNEAGAAIAADGSGTSLAASQLEGMALWWKYLNEHTRVELEALVSITTTGSVPGAAGGMHTTVDHPQMIMVGEAGRERVDVTPLTSGPHPPPISSGIPAFASGGSMTAGYSGGNTANVYITINGSDNNANQLARDLAAPLRREFRAMGFDVVPVR